MAKRWARANDKDGSIRRREAEAKMKAEQEQKDFEDSMALIASSKKELLNSLGEKKNKSSRR